MKKLFFILVLLPILGFSQTFFYGDGIFDSKFGVTIGTNIFNPKTNFISSKPGIGFNVGINSTAFISNHFEFTMGINYFQHYTTLLGRETELSETEDLKFKVATLNVPLVFDYIYLLRDDYKLGFNVGAAVSFFHEFEILDDTKEEYLLDPISLTARDLGIRMDGDKLQLNTYYSFGTNVQNEYFKLEVSYNKSLSNPYKDIAVRHEYLVPSGKDSFIALTLTYFFGDNDF